ncbi:MAG: LysR family transcriptional regulator [Paracoccaceae bacterium]
MYEWSDVRMFLAVARAGSALRAARSLGVNHSTVSRRIQALEHALGLTLFDRRNRGYSLTEHGTALMAAAETVARSAQDLQYTAERLRRAVSGVVRLTAPESIANQIIIPIVAEFQQQQPGVQVEQVAADTYLDIVHGEADIAFRAGSRPDDARLVAQRLPDMGWSAYCGRSYAKKNGVPAAPDHVRRHSVIGYDGVLRGSTGYRWLLCHVDEARITNRCNTVPNMRAVLGTGLGVGILPCFVGDPDPELIRCFEPPDELVAEFWLLMSEEARNTAQVRAFIDFAVPRITALRQSLRGRAPPVPGA